MRSEANRSGYGPGEVPHWVDYSRCVRCGLCLNACPTYRELGLEMDSPRGRIYQIIQVERGRLPLGESFVRHIDLCLDCRACETACPSGVEYGKLVEAARGQIEKYYKRPPLEALLRKFFFYAILPHRQRLGMAGKLLRFYQTSGLERLVLASRILKLLPGGWKQLPARATHGKAVLHRAPGHGGSRRGGSPLPGGILCRVYCQSFFCTAERCHGARAHQEWMRGGHSR